MNRWRWTDRVFAFDFPPAKLPDLLERLRGTPARLDEMLRDASRDTLTRHPDDGWSILQNVGHLLDLGYLPMTRIDQILAGEQTLIAADMSNEKTNAADHDARDVRELLAEFRAERMRLVQKLETLDESAWGQSGIHPRLKQPMRIVDIAYFDGEHDDYHLARIRELLRASEQTD